MELIKINKTQINSAEVNSVNARELHKALELKSDFSTWTKKELDLFTENVDYIRLHKKMEANNATMIEYILTLDTAKHLAMIQRNQKGKEVRDYFIQCEKEFNKPMTVEETLKHNAMLIEQLHNKVIVLEDKVTLDKPKVSYADAIVGSINPVSLRDWINSMKSDQGLCGFSFGVVIVNFS